jgi:hypothetical protein
MHSRRRNRAEGGGVESLLSLTQGLCRRRRIGIDAVEDLVRGEFPRKMCGDGGGYLRGGLGFRGMETGERQDLGGKKGGEQKLPEG